jgi:translocation and assembly module TamA
MTWRRKSWEKSARAGAFVLAAGLGLSGPAVALDNLTFNAPNADSALVETLRRSSFLVAAETSNLTDPLEIFTIARAEYGRLIGVLYEASYYSGAISVRLDGREAAEMSPLSPPAQIRRVDVTIELGPSFRFRRAEIGPLAPGTELPAAFQQGQAAGSTVIRDAAQVAVDGWRDDGYAKAAPSGQSILADHPAAELDAQITISPGPRLRFGNLAVSGQEHTRIDRITEIAGLPEGDVFSPAEARQAATRLRRTGTFASVALREADTPNPDNTLDFAVAVVEAAPRRIGFGAELDSEDGVRLSTFWLHRNLLGGAERLRVDSAIGGIGAKVGGIDYRFSAEFARPATFTPDTSFTMGVVAESVDQRNFDARRASIQIGLSHIFTDEITAQAGFVFQHERAHFGPTRATTGDFTTLAVPLSATWDRRDNTLNPTSGFYLFGEVMPFIGVAGADSGIQTQIDARGYYGLGTDSRFVLAGRAQVGAVMGAGIAATPRNFLFYSGGGGSVRGQPFESLGATAGGIASGGQGFATLSAEVRAGVTDTLGLVAFADAGYVSKGAFSGPADWHAGAGFGVRYDTRIGPLRMDVGLPVRGATSDGVQIYIGIGQAF